MIIAFGIKLIRCYLGYYCSGKCPLPSLHYDSPPKKKTLVKERHPDEPTLADVKARARKMHDELYEPGAPGFEAAKASFEALAL